jgi:putative acetyltransferase
MGFIRGRDNCSFTVNDSGELIAEELWLIAKGIIMTVIENQQNLIIEGSYLFP